MQTVFKQSKQGEKVMKKLALLLAVMGCLMMGIAVAAEETMPVADTTDTVETTNTEDNSEVNAEMDADTTEGAAETVPAAAVDAADVKADSAEPAAVKAEEAAPAANSGY
jgi:hypothetical protein